ncbi:MAG: hypothetical protein DRJ59_07905 [Thermoprotei archaeon]|nr:MAG: hypothetical protein DRJ59_07905 [Thermoprotei archaeon]
MASPERHTYYMSLKRRRDGWEILYNIGSEGKLMTVLRLNGKKADKIFEGVVKALAKQGAVVPSRVSDDEKVYAIREDLGPVIGAYFILVRRARNIEKWGSFLDDLLNEQYIGLAKAFSTFLELAIELSKSVQAGTSKRKYALSPIVVEALSTSLKQFVNKMIKLSEGY